MITIIAFILIFFWPYFAGFFGEAWKDLQIWVIQQRLNYYTRKYHNGGSVKGLVAINRLFRKAESLGCYISVIINSPGNGIGQMKITLITK